MKVTKAVFPVAGMGTRFLPATKSIPKEMLPLVDKPLIQYGVEEAILSGIEEIIFVTAVGKEAIENHFKPSDSLEALLESKGDTKRLDMIRRLSDMAKISTVIQDEPKGLGHAIYCAKELVGAEPFAVILPDDIIYSPKKPALKQLIDLHYEKETHVIASLKVAPDRVSYYGIIDPKEVYGPICLVGGMVEKPPVDKAPSDLAIIGRYIFTPELFRYIEKTKKDDNGEIQLTTAMNLMLENEPIYAVQFAGTRYDAGDKLGFLQATIDYALQDEEFGEAISDYINEKE